jgi:excisionase family DNA binding protein
MHSTIETTRLMTVKEAAKYLCISERKLWSMTQAGEITAVRFGRTVRYDIKDLENFIQRAKGVFVENA